MSDLVKSVLLKIKSDDGDTEEKLKRISERADELGRKHPELSVRIKTAEASAKMAALREELKHFGDEADKVKEKGGRFGIIHDLLLGAEGGAGGLSGLGSNIPLLGGLIPEGGAGGLAGLAAVVAGGAALITEATALVSGFAAAGAGVGAFALLAAPAIDKVKGALKDTSAQLAKLSPDERGAVLGIRGLKDEYLKMSSAFEPDAFKVFNQGLRIANKLLPALKPFADTAATALDGLLKHVAKFAGSSGFTSWLAQFHKLEGPAISAIGAGFGHVATSLGKLLTIMSKKDVVNAINFAFSVLDGTIIGLAAAVKYVMHAWDMATTYWDIVLHPAVDRLRHEFAHLGDDLGTLAGKVSGFVARSARDFANWNSDADKAVGRVVSYFEALPGRIASTLARLPGMLFAAGQHAISGLINGLKSMAGGLLHEAESIGHDIANAVTLPFGIHFSEPSEAVQMIKAGRNIGLGLQMGMDSTRGSLMAAAGRMGSAAMPGGYGHGGARADGGMTVNVYVNGFVGSNSQLAREIQTSLLNLKRTHGQKIDTTKGLGLA